MDSILSKDALSYFTNDLKQILDNKQNIIIPGDYIMLNGNELDHVPFRPKLLWENANPSASSYAAQTVYFGDKHYPLLMIFCKININLVVQKISGTAGTTFIAPCTTSTFDIDWTLTDEYLRNSDDSSMLIPLKIFGLEVPTSL